MVDRKLDMDSFLWPLIEDLRALATTGIDARRWIDGKLQSFTMRAHLILVSGDMPAISKVRAELLASVNTDIFITV